MHNVHGILNEIVELARTAAKKKSDLDVWAEAKRLATVWPDTGLTVDDIARAIVLEADRFEAAVFFAKG